MQPCQVVCSELHIVPQSRQSGPAAAPLECWEVACHQVKERRTPCPEPTWREPPVNAAMRKTTQIAKPQRTHGRVPFLHHANLAEPQHGAMMMRLPNFSQEPRDEDDSRAMQQHVLDPRPFYLWVPDTQDRQITRQKKRRPPTTWSEALQAGEERATPQQRRATTPIRCGRQSSPPTHATRVVESGA